MGTPHNGSRRSRRQSDISNSETTTPTVLGNIPLTNPKSDNLHNTPTPNIHGGQHADAIPRPEKTPNNSGNQQGHSLPPRGTSNPTGNPQMPHQRTQYKNIRQGCSNHNAYNQTPTNQDPNWQYQWFSPLRDIQPSIFNPSTTTYPEDNYIHAHTHTHT